MMTHVLIGISLAFAVVAVAPVAIFVFYFVKAFREAMVEWRKAQETERRFLRVFTEYPHAPDHVNCRCVLEWEDVDPLLIPLVERCDEDEYTDEFREHLMATEWVIREVIEEMESREDDEEDDEA